MGARGNMRKGTYCTGRRDVEPDTLALPLAIGASSRLSGEPVSSSFRVGRSFSQRKGTPRLLRGRKRERGSSQERPKKFRDVDAYTKNRLQKNRKGPKDGQRQPAPHLSPFAFSCFRGFVHHNPCPVSLSLSEPSLLCKVDVVRRMSSVCDSPSPSSSLRSSPADVLDLRRKRLQIAFSVTPRLLRDLLSRQDGDIAVHSWRRPARDAVST